MSLIERDHTVADWLAEHPQKVRPCRDCKVPIFFARFTSGAMVPFNVQPATGVHWVQVIADRLTVRRMPDHEADVHLRHAGVTHTVHQCERTRA